MQTIDQIIENTLVHEGKFQAWKADRGNYWNGQLVGTNWGITPADVARFRGTRTVTMHDMKTLGRDEAKAIYLAFYYEAPGVEKLPDPLEAHVYDMAVNHGPSRAIRVLQAAINAFVGGCDVDGKLGPQTVRLSYQMAEAVPMDVILEALVEERISFYRAIVRNNPSQGVFLKGWLRRANAFRPGNMVTLFAANDQDDESLGYFKRTLDIDEAA